MFYLDYTLVPKILVLVILNPSCLEIRVHTARNNIKSLYSMNGSLLCYLKDVSNDNKFKTAVVVSGLYRWVRNNEK